MRIACATNDGNSFVTSHFGDAQQYDLYEMTKEGYRFLQSITNHTEEEEGVHADPKKAHGIVSLLKEQNVQIGVSLVFGPNIKRVAKHILPIIISEKTIKEGLSMILNQYEFIINALKKEDSGYITLNKEQTVNYTVIQ
ncbi:MAG TPA: NifB/NifX family molybdenum-iron cluster-binding protein [Thermotogota bacterium]|nr:NifB/NifX family molybdenum-iron cluster-binding protein [Thermotogota bacterium]HRW35760.1 NifB/NifX family molybdenum-iron cluster-binding protein [Thermotogota bacterium]